MKRSSVCSSPWLWGLLALAALITTPAHALKIFLDHNTDGDLTTFENVAVGLTVPIDIIVQVEPEDVDAEIHFGQVEVVWDYENESGDLYCYDTVGSVNWFVPIPDSPPYVNIFTDTCVCRSCICVSFFLIGAETNGVVKPGFYRLATLDFTRTGSRCGAPFTYPQAQFELNCSWGCTNPQGDPRQTMLLLDTATDVEAHVLDETWGQVKALYR